MASTQGQARSRDENRVGATLKAAPESGRPKTRVAFAVREEPVPDIERVTYAPVTVSAEMSLSVLQRRTLTRSALVRSVGLLSYPSVIDSENQTTENQTPGSNPMPFSIPMDLENRGALPCEPAEIQAGTPAADVSGSDFGDINLDDILGNW